MEFKKFFKKLRGKKKKNNDLDTPKKFLDNPKKFFDEATPYGVGITFRDKKTGKEEGISIGKTEDETEEEFEKRFKKVENEFIRKLKKRKKK